MDLSDNLQSPSSQIQTEYYFRLPNCAPFAFPLSWLCSRSCQFGIVTCRYLKQSHKESNSQQLETPQGTSPQSFKHSRAPPLFSCSVISFAYFFCLFSAWLILKPVERLVCPTQGRGRCVLRVSSLSTSSRDAWLMERSTTAAVSGNSTTHKARAACCFACVSPQILF